ncbi:hypothetical protein KC852_01540 [Candidatus Nomurabacteria bacterium]|nr:hypothetical protein [Candidatus Nomurabacteria bacterium]
MTSVKINKKIIIYVLIIVSILTSIYIVLRKNSDSLSNQDAYQLVHSFNEGDGKKIGDMYVKYIDNIYVFSDLYIVDPDNNILYRINKSGFFSGDSGQTEIPVSPDVYGYILSVEHNDSFGVEISDQTGVGISDNVNVMWNYDNKKFELIKF